MRSGLGGGLVGRRTFLHPVIGIAARYKDPIEPFYGAPQSVASHALADRGDEVGLFFEAAPLHPMLAALASAGFGALHHEIMQQLPYLSAHIALAIDGFHRVGERRHRRACGPRARRCSTTGCRRACCEALREGLKALAEIDFAAGAERSSIGDSRRW